MAGVESQKHLRQTDGAQNIPWGLKYLETEMWNNSGLLGGNHLNITGLLKAREVWGLEVPFG